MESGTLAIWAFALGFGIGQTNSAASGPLSASQVAPVVSPATGDRLPAVAILLDDAAGVSPATLVKTKAVATNVLRQAGVQVRWIDCSFAEAEHRDPPGCQLSLDVPTVIVKVLSDAESRRWRPPVNRLGFCIDKDVYLLMPEISAVSERQALPVWLVLGHALLHETGHALLGAGHSRGIMRPAFRKTDWGKAEKGQLLFEAYDAHRIREELVKLAGGR
jgi:hypothetical protein